LPESGIIGQVLVSTVHDGQLKNLFIFLINILKSKVAALAKLMPIANVNRILFAN